MGVMTLNEYIVKARKELARKYCSRCNKELKGNSYISPLDKNKFVCNACCNYQKIYAMNMPLGK